MCFLAWWTFRIFFIFSARGRERGSEAPERGWEGSVFIENARRGGLPGERRRGGRRAGRASAGNLGGRGGLNIFFGAEMPTKLGTQNRVFLSNFGVEYHWGQKRIPT